MFHIRRRARAPRSTAPASATTATASCRSGPKRSCIVWTTCSRVASASSRFGVLLVLGGDAAVEGEVRHRGAFGWRRCARRADVGHVGHGRPFRPAARATGRARPVVGPCTSRPRQCGRQLPVRLVRLTSQPAPRVEDVTRQYGPAFVGRPKVLVARRCRFPATVDSLPASLSTRMVVTSRAVVTFGFVSAGTSTSAPQSVHS
jgi:hypothetical protein